MQTNLKYKKRTEKDRKGQKRTEEGQKSDKKSAPDCYIRSTPTYVP